MKFEDPVITGTPNSDGGFDLSLGVNDVVVFDLPDGEGIAPRLHYFSGGSSSYWLFEGGACTYAVKLGTFDAPPELCVNGDWSFVTAVPLSSLQGTDSVLCLVSSAT